MFNLYLSQTTLHVQHFGQHVSCPFLRCVPFFSLLENLRHFVCLFSFRVFILRQSRINGILFNFLSHTYVSLNVQFVYFLELQAIYVNRIRTPCIASLVPYAAPHVMRNRGTHMDSVVRKLMRHERNKSGEKSYKYFTSVQRTFHY